MKYEKQIKMVENWKQIGYRLIKDEIYLECGIQKREDSLYLVHMAKCDLKYDYDNTNPEFYSYSNLEDAIAYIVSRGFPFDEFKPQKGNKIFDINDPRFPNLDEN